MVDDFETAPIGAAERAMLRFAVKLTRQPHAIDRGDVQALRDAGLSDAAVSHVVQVTALFNYYTRIADGLGIDPEPEWGPSPWGRLR